MSILPQPSFDNPDMCSVSPPSPLAVLQDKHLRAQNVLAGIKAQQERARKAGDMGTLKTLTQRHGEVCASLSYIENEIANAEFDALMQSLRVAA